MKNHKIYGSFLFVFRKINGFTNGGKEMIRGTTPTHEFILPFSVDVISEVEITYKQSNTCLLVKHKKDCILEDNKISVRLSQKETFKFAKSGTVSVQVRILTTGGDVLASDIHRVNCDDCLSEGVLK